MAINAIIIEDDDQTREALCSALIEGSKFVVSGSASNYADGETLINSDDFDVMLIDLDLAGKSGINLIQKCNKQNESKIIVITVLGDEDSVISAIESGADGYVLKDSAFGDLPTLVERVLNGEAPISPAVARYLLRRFQTDPGAGAGITSPSLSRRERQVLRELAIGASYKEVAIKYDLSIHTIGDYVKSLYKKLSVSSRGEAVNKAVRHGIIKL